MPFAIDDIDEEKDVELPPGFVKGDAEDNNSDDDDADKKCAKKTRSSLKQKTTTKNKFSLLGQLDDSNDESDCGD